MTVVLSVALVILVSAAALALVRLQRGPTNLDRAVALDVVASITIGVVVVVSAASRRLDLLPLLAVLTSVGFISSTVIARFTRRETATEHRLPGSGNTLTSGGHAPTDAVHHDPTKELG